MSTRQNLGMRLIEQRRRRMSTVNDVQTLVAALGGDSKVLAFYDTNYNVTNDGAGHVTAWDDARGAAGYGPQLVAGKGAGAYPAWDSTNKTITTDGSQNWLETVMDAKFDFHSPRTIIVIAAAPAAASYMLSVGNGSGFTKVWWMGINGSLSVGSALGGEAPANARTTNSANHRLIINLHDGTSPGTGVNVGNVYQYLEGWGRLRTLRDGNATFSAGNNQLMVGRISGAANYASAIVKTIVVLDGPLSMAGHDALIPFATARGIVIDSSAPALIADGNSLTAGYAASNPTTKNWLAQMVTAHAALASYDTLNAGLSGKTATMIVSPTNGGTSTQQKDRTLAAYNAARPKNFYVYWEGINDDIVQHADATTSIANAQKACQDAKARGFTVLVLTQLKSGTAGGFNADETRRLTYNAAIRNFVTNGFADAVVDVASNPNLIDPTNTTYFYTDQLHLTDAGYNEVANHATYGVWPALSALGV